MIDCEECDFITMSPEDLSTHQAEQHVFNSLFSFIADYKSPLYEKEEKNEQPVGMPGLKEEARRDPKEKKCDIKTLQCSKTPANKDIKSFKCTDCEYSTSSIKNLEDHKQSKHNGVIRFTCSLCEYKSYFKHNLSNHIRKHHKGDEARIMLVDCVFCETGEIHEKCATEASEDTNKTFSCKECNFQTNFKQSLQNHVSNKHENVLRFACNICGKKSYHKANIQSHQKIHKNESCKILRIGCVKCKRKEDHTRCRSSKSSANLRKKRQQPKKGKFQCNECDYSSHKKYSVKKHTESKHKGILKFFCRDCPYQSYYKNDMIAHMKAHSDSQGPPLRIGCQKCENYIEHRCRKSQATSTHSQTTDKPKEKPIRFNCDECQSFFPSEEHLKRHLLSQVHQGIVRFYCNQCNFKAFYSKRVRLHQKDVHSDRECKVLRIGCTDCEANVEDHNCLLKVKRKKSKRRKDTKGLFKCKDCDYSNSRSYKLFNHVQSVHLDIVKYYCSSCDFKSYFRYSVKIHQNNSHAGTQCLVKKIGCSECADNVDHKCKAHVGIIRCDKCSFKTKYKNRLRRHQKYHNANGTGSEIERKVLSTKKEKGRSILGELKCIECDYSTDVPLTLKNHVLKDHLNILKFYCGLCDYKSFYKHNVKIHQTLNHKEEECKVKRIGCQDCLTDKDHICKSSRKERRRTEEKEGQKRKISESKVVCGSSTEDKFFCPDCDYSSDKQLNLNIHRENIHRSVKKYVCSNCDLRNYFSSSIKAHIKTHHKDDPEARPLRIGCRKCELAEPHTSCSSRGGRREGKDPGMPLNVKEYECSLCENKPKFINKKLKLKHFQETHPGQHIYNCRDCPYGTNYLPNLNTHCRSQHEKKRLECHMCDWSTTWNTTFHMHLRTKHGYFKKKSKHYNDCQQYLCDMCAFSTFSKIESERHKMSHVNGDPHDPSENINRKRGRLFIPPAVPNAFRCNKCHYSSQIVGNLRAHIKQVHDGVMFECELCDYKATAKHNLKIHIENIHDGIRYKCDKCDHISTTKANLKVHNLVVHEKGVKFQCKMCNYKTFQIFYLNYHVKTHHEKK